MKEIKRTNLQHNNKPIFYESVTHMLSTQLSFNGTASYSREVKFKIELPGAVSRWSFALLIKKGQTELDYLEKVHIATQ